MKSLLNFIKSILFPARVFTEKEQYAFLIGEKLKHLMTKRFNIDLLSVQLKITTLDDPILGVTLHYSSGKTTIELNRSKINKLSRFQIYCLIIHELAHAIEFHFKDERSSFDGYHNRIWQEIMINMNLPPNGWHFEPIKVCYVSKNYCPVYWL